MSIFDDIITSKVRVKILDLFFSNLTEMYHVRGIVREIGEEINAVRRELERLEKAGLIKKEPRGNRIYYFVRIDYSGFGDFLSIVAKSTGIGKMICDSRSKLGKVSFVMFSGKFVRMKPSKKDNNVDILVVGEVVLPELAMIVRNFESKLGREINYTVMTKEELDYRKKRRDPFLQEIFLGSRVMIIGDEEELTC